jgi:3D (Asp-Asp-Asp) domain-containing protein
VLGDAHPPRGRLLCVFAAAALVVVIPAAAGQPKRTTRPNDSAARLRAENTQLAARARSAVLGLYSLDSRLAAADTRLARLTAEAQGLRTRRAELRQTLKVDRVGEQISEHQLASQLRHLYEQGEPSPIEVVLGAKSLDDAMTELENVKRVASLSDDVLAELRSARKRLTITSRELSTETAQLDTAIATAAATEVTLQQTRVARSAYLSELTAKQSLNSSAIARIEFRARAAESRSAQLTGSQPAATVATLSAATNATPLVSGKTLTVSVTGYSLSGTTATGLPVGWGVAAVDPRVIPLGTHIWIPGYGEAIAADVGSAIVGERLDLWFPTVAQADLWGRQTVTITLR